MENSAGTFIWKGYSSSLDANLSIALLDDKVAESIVTTEGSLVFAVTVFTTTKDIELCTFSAEFLKKNALHKIESGELVTDIEDVAIEYMRRLAEHESEYSTKQ